MRFVRALAVSVVVLVLFAWGFAALTDDDSTAGQEHFADGLAGLRLSTTTKIALSPDGGRLLAVQDGQVQVVRLGDASTVMRAGRNVVDAAWMPDGERVLTLEGPIPTGQVVTLDMNGEVDGVATLSPSVGFGDGSGVDVDSRGVRAAAITTTRDAIGGRTRTDLAVVELQTGTVRVYATPDRDEHRPLFVDDDYVAVVSQAATGPPRLDFVDLTTGAVRAGGPVSAGPFARTLAGEVVVARGGAGGVTRLVAVDAVDGAARRLHETGPGRRVVAVDAQITRCIVRVGGADGVARLVIEPFA